MNCEPFSCFSMNLKSPKQQQQQQQQNKNNFQTLWTAASLSRSKHFVKIPKIPSIFGSGCQKQKIRLGSFTSGTWFFQLKMQALQAAQCSKRVGTKCHFWFITQSKRRARSDTDMWELRCFSAFAQMRKPRTEQSSSMTTKQRKPRAK